MLADGNRSALSVTIVSENTAILGVPLIPIDTLELTPSTATLDVPLAIAVPLPAPVVIPVKNAPLPYRY